MDRYDILIEQRVEPVAYVDQDGLHPVETVIVEGSLARDGSPLVECWCPHNRDSLPHRWVSYLGAWSCPEAPVPGPT